MDVWVGRLFQESDSVIQCGNVEYLFIALLEKLFSCLIAFDAFGVLFPVFCLTFALVL